MSFSRPRGSFSLFFLWCFTASLLHAGESLNPDLAVFEAWRDPKGVTLTKIDGNEIPLAPIHRLFGFFSLAKIQDSEFPVKISFLYRKSQALKRIPPKGAQDNSSPSQWQSARFVWGQPQDILLAQEPAEPDFTFEVQTPLAERDRPVAVLDAPSRTPSLWPLQAEVSSLEILIENKEGKILSRRELIRAYQPPQFNYGTAALTLDDPEAERFFLNERVTQVINESRLPPEIAAYDPFSSVWISTSALADPAVSLDLFRRLLLSGIHLAGRPGACERVGALLGIPANSAVLHSALFSASNSTSSFVKPRMSEAYDSFTYSPPGSTEKRFADIQPVGKNQVQALTRQTRRLLTAFVVFESLILILGFRLFSGEKRVFLWVGVPLSAILYSLGVLLFIPLAVQLRTSYVALEVQYSYEDWPEALREVRLKILSFSSKALDWEAPGKLRTLYSPQYPRASFKSVRQSSLLAQSGESTRLKTRTERGSIFSLPLSSWIKNDPPCRMESPRAIRFLAGFDKAWVWDGSNWKDLGKVNPQDLSDLSRAPKAFEEGQYFNRIGVGAGQPDEYGQDQFYSGMAGLPVRVRLLTNAYRNRDPLMSGQGILIGMVGGRSSVKAAFESRGDVQEFSLRVHGFKLARGPSEARR